MRLRTLLGSVGLAAGSFLLLAAPALAKQPNTGPAGSNAGRVWLEDSDFDNGNEPHFACGDQIRILGSHMAQTSNTFEVLSWAPTSNGYDQKGTWNFDPSGPDRQQIAVVGVAGKTIPAGHYRVDVEQKNAKHKMFWVEECSTGTSGSSGTSGTAAPTSTPTPTGSTEAQAVTAPTPTPNGEVEAATAQQTGGHAGAGPTGSVLAAVGTLPGAAAVGGVLAATGTPLALLAIGLLMLGAGAFLLVRRNRQLD